MFIVCEPVALGMEHVPFNAALLKTICLAFPNAEVRFYGEHSHIQFIKEQIEESFSSKIDWHNLILPPRHSKFFSRLSADFNTVKSMLGLLGNHPQKDVLVITGNASIIWALKYYTRKDFKNQRVQVVIHSDFSTLVRIPRREILNPLYYVGSLKTALRLPGYQRLQHIVLEEAVRNKVIERLPFLNDHMVVLDHPIPIDKNHETDASDLEYKKGQPIHFGYLGRATKQKGFFRYLDVAVEISERFPGQAKFHYIGRVSEKIKKRNKSKMTFLTEIPENNRLSRSEYTDRLKNLHYVCLFYDSYYDYCASGVLMDSIAWKKPIIANKIVLFETIQNRFGEIGHLCKPNEIYNTITDVLEKFDKNKYRLQVENLGKLRTSRTPDKLALKYIEIVR